MPPQLYYQCRIRRITVPPKISQQTDLSIRINIQQTQSRNTKEYCSILNNTSLLNTQPYKVRIEGKVELYTERISALSYTSV